MSREPESRPHQNRWAGVRFAGPAHLPGFTESSDHGLMAVGRSLSWQHRRSAPMSCGNVPFPTWLKLVRTLGDRGAGGAEVVG